VTEKRLSSHVLFWSIAAWLAVAAASAGARQLRQPDVHFTPARHAVADAMLRLAGVTHDDVVYDLGSGDGRIVVIAAQKYRARGVGIEIDQRLVETSRAIALEGGVADRVLFVHGDLFTADISPATVVTLFLTSSINRRLEPKLRRELTPGARVVSLQFPIGDWTADDVVQVDTQAIYLYTIRRR
jgi:SAM-dependent methyltransferase